MIDIISRDGLADPRVVPGIPEILLKRLRPFPESARPTVYRNTHDRFPINGFNHAVHSGDFEIYHHESARSKQTPGGQSSRARPCQPLEHGFSAAHVPVISALEETANAATSKYAKWNNEKIYSNLMAGLVPVGLQPRS